MLRKASKSGNSNSSSSSNSKSGYFLEPNQIFPPDCFPSALLVSVPPKTPHAAPEPNKDPTAFLSQLALICDVKQGWDSFVYRLNDDKLMKWLRKKVQQVCEQLITLPSFQLVDSSNSGNHSDKAKFDFASVPPSILKQSLAFLGEYLCLEDFTRLCESFALNPDSVTQGRTKKPANADNAASEYVFSSAPPEDVGFEMEQNGVINADVDFSKPFSASAAAIAAKNDLSKRKSDGKGDPPASAKKLAKIDTKGMKSLSSFFGKK